MIYLTFVLRDEHLDVPGNVLIEVEFASVERFYDGAIVEKQETSMSSHLQIVNAPFRYKLK
jgi:hypothetical protein